MNWRLSLRLEMGNQLEAFTKVRDVKWTRGFHWGSRCEMSSRLSLRLEMWNEFEAFTNYSFPWQLNFKSDFIFHFCWCHQKSMTVLSPKLPDIYWVTRCGKVNTNIIIYIVHYTFFTVISVFDWNSMSCSLCTCCVSMIFIRLMQNLSFAFRRTQYESKWAS